MNAKETTLTSNKILCACGCGIVLDRYNKQGRERKFKNGHNGRYRPDEKIICRICGSDKTFHRKTKRDDGSEYLKQDWYNVDRINKTGVCNRCYTRVVNREYTLKKSKCRIKYKGKYITLNFEPRVQVCNWCRSVVPFDTPYTQLHHDEGYYDDNDPLKNTIELCASCHSKERWRLGECDIIYVKQRRTIALGKVYKSQITR